nr:hypothetical protein [uncultured Cellulosilyticum sp.]
MEKYLGVSSTYSDIMNTVIADIKESVAVKKLKETNEVLTSLGYSKDEIRDILRGVLGIGSCN